MPDSDFQRYLDTKFEGIFRELSYIRENTDRTEERQSRQEKRIHNLERTQDRCPVNQLKKDMEQHKKDIDNVRLWAKMTKVGFPLIFLTALGLILQIFGII